MKSFQDTLRQLHRQRQLGRLTAILLFLAALWGLGMLALGFADFHFALSTRARLTALIALGGVLGLAALIGIVRVLRTPLSDTASRADRSLQDNRNSSLSAVHLAHKSAETPMEQFHLDRTLTEASSHLQKISFLAKVPAKALAIVALLAALTGVTIITIRSLAPEPFSVVAARLLSPTGETPPYSPLRFKISPETPSALYQGETTVEVEISGGEITGDVICLVRDPATGLVQETTTFREEAGRYARKFENTLAPLEFAFATGIARSDWHRLDVLFQPRITGAEILITPPAYTGKAASNYPLEAGEIKALEGSEITLKISSNRPLIGGTLTLEGLDQGRDNPVSTVEAEVASEKEVAFRWTAHRSAKISALIQDIRYTPADQPLELDLKTIPDQAPFVTINEPQAMVLATPQTTIPMNGDIEDDYGLAEVSLTRTLVGYRDRAKTVAEGLSEKNFDFQSPLALAPLGVEPGQILEFYLEAADRNPSLLGVGVSDVVRVQIISEEDYAQRIRNQLDLKNFTARYRALAQAIEEARKALEELEKAGTESEREAAEKKAADAHERARELSDRIAEDFKAFDLEGRLQESARAASDALSQNLNDLPKLSKFPADREAAIEEMQERLGGAARQAKQIEQDAELVKKMGDVLEMAAEYRRLVNAQKSIIKRLKEVTDALAAGNLELKNRLPGLAKTQEKNRDALLKFAETLAERAEALPEEAAQMKTDVAKFLEKLEQLDIPNPMDAASDAARRGQAVESLRRANLALQLMERLIEEPGNGFCQACQGQCMPRFQIKQDMASTMQQMLDALMARAGEGEGQGGDGGVGGGPGGGGQDGYSVAGNSAAIPAYGPNRLNFSQSQLTASRGPGLKPGRGNAGKGTSPTNAEAPDPEEFRENENQAIVPDNIPAKYREAVKRYFSETQQP